MNRTLPAFAVITALILGVGIALFFLGASAGQERKYGYDPSRYPEVLQEKDFEQADDLAKLYGFIGWDVRAKNMTRLSIGFLALQAFDEETRWPEKERRPKGFQPEAWLKIGKEPGLGLRNLHLQSVRGRGVTVAVFDKGINPNHAELAGRIKYHALRTPLAQDFQYRIHFHGLACASILCGRTVGIAPEAELHYFAVPDDGRNAENYCLAMEELLKLNADLPAEKKIRLVSISDGVGRDDAGIYEKWRGLVERARRAGVAVICSERETTHAVFTWGGCPPFLDRDDPENYDYAGWPRRNDPGRIDKIILPADYRTTAQNRTDTAYVYWGDGGFSWAIPYFAGLATLAWSLDGGLTIDEIYGLIKDTKSRTAAGRMVVNPEAFIRAVRDRRT